jgi:hypothetical protein
MWFVVLPHCAYTPRNNIANAKIAGLPKTLAITNTQYNTCLMIFYVGCQSQNPVP